MCEQLSANLAYRYYFYEHISFSRERIEGRAYMIGRIERTNAFEVVVRAINRAATRAKSSEFSAAHPCRGMTQQH